MPAIALLLVLLAAACTSKPEVKKAQPSEVDTPLELEDLEPREKARAPSAPATARESSSSPARPAQTEASCRPGDKSACLGACDRGDTKACTTAGRLLVESDEWEERDRCGGPLEKACDAREGEACFVLESCLDWIARRAGSQPDRGRAAQLRSRSCEMGFGAGCISSANSYYEGYGVSADSVQGDQVFKKGIEILVKECDAKRPESCFLLGSLHEWPSGKPIKATKAKAKKYYKLACGMGYEPGCLGVTRIAGQ